MCTSSKTEALWNGYRAPSVSAAEAELRCPLRIRSRIAHALTTLVTCVQQLALLSV
jgi:hypothetical protein